MFRRHLFSAIAALAIAAHGATHAAVTLTRFGHLGAGNESYFRAISDDGSVAYGDSLITGDPAAQGTIYRMAKWTPAGGHQDLGNGVPTAPAPNYYYSTIPNATSADGRVVVGHDGGTLVGRRAFRWSAATGFEYLGSGFPTLRARAVSPDGSTTLVESEAGSVLAWAGSTVTTIPNLRQATGVSTGGAVIAGNASPLGTGGAYRGASRWTSATGTQLLPTLGFGATAGPVTPGGTIAGIAGAATGSRLVLWPASGGIVDLGDASRIMSDVTAITPDAHTIVGTATFRTPSPRTEAVIWNQTSGFTRVSDLLAANGIDLGKFFTFSLDDVTADGQTFVGYLHGSNGATEGVLLTLPEPTAAASLLPLAAMLLSRRRGR